MAIRRKDPQIRRVITVAKAAVAITAGDLVKKNGTSNNVTNNVSAGDAILGICVKTTTSSATTVDIDILCPGEWCVADVGTGTPASGDFKSCDIRNSSSIAKDVAVGTDSSHDCLYMWNGGTGTVDVLFHKLETISAN